MKKNYFLIIFIIGCIMALILSSCATFTKVQLSPEQALRQRVATYWEARIKGDPEGAYELLVPLAREAVSLGVYAMRTSSFKILDYRIESVSMGPDNKEAVVRVWRSFKIKSTAVPIRIDKVLEQTSESRWFLVKGKWYMEYNLLPPLNFKKD